MFYLMKIRLEPKLHTGKIFRDFLKKIFIFSIVFFFLFGQIGCTPKITIYGGFLEDRKETLGNIGIISIAEVPEIQFEMPPKGALAGASRGMKAWSSRAFFQVLAEGPVRAVGNGNYLESLLVLAATSLAIGSIVGPIYGAVTAEPIGKVEQAEQSLRQALGNLRIFQKMRKDILVQAETKPQYFLIDATKTANEIKNASGGSPNFEKPEIDTLLIIQGITLGVKEEDDSFESLISVFLETQIILLRVKDSKPIYFNIFDYETKPRLYTDWAENNAQLFKEALNTASQNIANLIIEEIFMEH